MNPNQAPLLSYLCCFEKTGPIRFISHLDLTRTFHRAFARANVPIKFSEGFTPHPKFSFALPLSVGTESICEWAAFTLREKAFPDEEAFRSALQDQMPAGIRILRILPQTVKLSEIAFCSYEITLPHADPSQIPLLEATLQEDLTVQKKNKKGKTVEKSISSGIRQVSLSESAVGILIRTVLAASGEEYLKPEALLQALEEKVSDFHTEQKRILRTKVYTADLTAFDEILNESLKG